MSEHGREIAGLHCSAVLALLSDYVDGDLDAVTRASVDAHLAACSVCEAFGGEFAVMVRAVRARAQDATLDAALVARLTRRLEAD